MRRILFSAAAVLCTLVAFTQSYNVTFRVNMNDVAAPFTTPEVNGNFNGWCGGCAPMSDPDQDGIWELTTAINVGSYEYKFAYDSWAGQETLLPGSFCTLTSGQFTNRVLTVSSDVTLPLVCWESCTDCGVGLAVYDVTFRVDMNEVTDPFTTPEVNGVFNGWCGSCAPMSDVDMDGIWEITIALEEGNYAYKYSYDAWAGQENLAEGSSCTITNDGFTNRSLSLTGDVTLPLVCWGSCVDCSTIELTQMDLPVTFEEAGVDYGVIGFGDASSSIVTDPTNDQNTVVEVIKLVSAATWAGTTVSNANETGLNLAVPFTDVNTQMSVRTWSPDAGITVRLKVEDHTDPTKSCETEAMTTVAGEWETLTFDFANEAVGTAVLNTAYNLDVASIFFNFGVDGATAGEKTYYFDDLMFGAGGGPIIHDVTFQVDMNNVAAPFTTPEVNGTFNGWCGGCAAMSDSNSDGIWEITIPIEEGTYEYKFAYDSWAGQENLTSGSACTVTNDGFTNRALVVSSDATLPVVCWESCVACDVIVETFDVTFQVDMNNVVGPFTTPEINGTFNGWCGACAPLTDNNADGIWEITIPLVAGSYEYKFAYDNWASSEQLTAGSSCTVTADGFTNRALVVSADATLPVVCWASCTTCNTSGIYNVLFQVDMNNVVGPFTTPEVNGTFNAWCGACAPMSDANSDGVWEVSIALGAGSYEYKFSYDNWTGQENLASGSSCTVTTGNFTNRTLSVTTDAVLDVVCWESCNDCSNPEGPFNVTFSVDMNEVTAPFTTPEVNGTFNAWCGGCAPMADPDGNNVWELVISLPAGTHEYKFAYDSWAGQEELTPGSACTVTAEGFTNRALTVTEVAVLPTVCWASCAACIVGVEEQDALNVLQVFPNPAQDHLQIELNKAVYSPVQMRITDIRGVVVFDQKVTIAQRYQLDTSEFSDGMYFINVTSDKLNVVQSFIVRN